MDKLTDKVYDILFSPKEFFSLDREEFDFSNSIIIISIISFFVFAMNYKTGNSFNLFAFFAGGVSAIIFGILGCALFSYFVDLIANIFDKGGHTKDLFCRIAYAGLPWIFFAPLNLIKAGCTIGYLLGTFWELFIFVYVIYLYIKSVSTVYNLSFEKSLLLLSLPLIGNFFAVAWTIGFFSKLVYMFSK